MEIVRVDSVSAVSGIGSSYNVNKIIPINMDMYPPTQAFEGFLSLIVVQMNTINASTEITIRVTTDAEGDKMIITDTKSDIFTGITTGTKGTAIFAMNNFVKLKDTNDLYCFAKTDTGTVTIEYIFMVYEGDR